MSTLLSHQHSLTPPLHHSPLSANPTLHCRHFPNPDSPAHCPVTEKSLCPCRIVLFHRTPQTLSFDTVSQSDNLPPHHHSPSTRTQSHLITNPLSLQALPLSPAFPHCTWPYVLSAFLHWTQPGTAHLHHHRLVFSGLQRHLSPHPTYPLPKSIQLDPDLFLLSSPPFSSLLPLSAVFPSFSVVFPSPPSFLSSPCRCKSS